MKMYNIKPANQRVVVLPDNQGEQRTAGGIIIPKSANEDKPSTGTVVSTGLGNIDYPMEYYKGQKVLYSQYAGVDVELDIKGHGRNTYKVMNQMDIMAILEETK